MARLSSILMEQRHFDIEDLTGNPELIASHLKLQEDYQKKINSLTDELHAKKLEFNTYKKNQSWGTWAVSIVSSTKEQTEYNQEQKNLLEKIAIINQEYLKKSRRLDAEFLAPQFIAPNMNIQDLQELIVPQLETMEDLLSSLKANAQYGDSETFIQETKQITEYKDFLKNNNFIQYYIGDKKIPKAQDLQDDFLQAYAEYMFYSINEQTLFNREEYSATHTQFMQDKALETKTKKDFLQFKLQLAVEHHNDIAYQNAKEQIDKDLAWVTIEKYNTWLAQSIKSFNEIPGSYMLDPKDAEQFINKLLILAERKERHKRDLDNSKKTASYSYETQKAMHQERCKFTEELTKSLLAQIIANIDKAATHYKHPAEDSAEFAGYTINTKDIISKARSQAFKELDEIPHNQLLSEQEKLSFINQLAIINQSLLAYNEISWFAKEWKIIGKEKKELYKEQATVINNIKKAILDHFVQESKHTIDYFYNTSKLKDITDTKLHDQLKQQLTHAIAETKGLIHKTSNENYSATQIADTINGIKIALVLDKLDSFRSLPLDQQELHIKTIKNNLNIIKKNGDEIAEIESSESDKKYSNIKNEKQKLNKEKDEAFANIQQLLTDITVKHQDVEDVRQELDIADHTTVKDLTDKIKEFFQNPTVQGVITGALVGGLAVLAAPLANNIPVIGGNMATTTVAAPAAIAAGAGGGGLLGGIFPQVRYLWKPFTYVASETKDIINKPKSYIDRGFRASAILGATAGVGLGVGLFLAANPITAPILAATILGTVMLGGPVIAGATYMAKKISNTTSKLIYGVTDIDLFKPTPQAIQRLQGLENANAVSNFLKQEIQKLTTKLDHTPRSHTSDKIALKNKIGFLKATWGQIQQGRLDYWENASRLLYLEKKKDCFEQVNALNNSDVINDLLKTVTNKPKGNDNDQLSMKDLEHIMEQHPEQIHFSDPKNNAIVSKYKEEIKQIQQMHHIINRNQSKL